MILRTPQGKLIASIMASLAEFERDLIIECAKDGMRNNTKLVADLFAKSALNASKFIGLAMLLVVSFDIQVLANSEENVPKQKNCPTLQGASVEHSSGMEACKQAKNLLDKRDYKGAIKSLDNVIGCAYVYRIEAYMGLEQYQKAINDCSKYIEEAPDDILGCCMRGIAYEKLGQHEKAIDDFSTTIRMHPSGLAKPYCYRGSIYQKLGQYQKAIDDFSRAIQMNSKELALDLEQHPYVKAAKPTLISELASAYNGRAQAHEKLGNHDLAEQDRKKEKELGCKTD